MDSKLRDNINRILFHVLSNEERADSIIELLDAQRCEWKDDGYGDYATQCDGYFSFYHNIVDDKYCPHCGRRIEVKDGQ